jgi:1,4-alpha-glucan branching enzyme
LSDKQPYFPQHARDKAAEHAGNFFYSIELNKLNIYRELMDRPPIVVSMYDAELFGHWWFEVPDFINFLFRKMQYDQNIIKPITPSEYLNKFPVNQIVTPAASSWGDKGYYEVWLNEANDYIYRHLHRVSDRKSELANKFADVGGILKRALNQSARELLLAQSSDWAFIMTTGTMVEYAKKEQKIIWKILQNCIHK